MILKVSCEHCGSSDLQQTNVEGIYYCNCCDEEIGFSEMDIVVVE